jgi:hypothetical protein
VGVALRRRKEYKLQLENFFIAKIRARQDELLLGSGEQLHCQPDGVLLEGSLQTFPTRCGDRLRFANVSQVRLVCFHGYEDAGQVRLKKRQRQTLRGR